MMIRKEEYLFLYNSNQIEDKVALGHALAFKEKKLNQRDIHKDHLTPKQVVDVANLLNLSAKDLLLENIRATLDQFSEDDLIRLMADDPSKMKTPIILSLDNSFIVSSSYELIKEKLETYENSKNVANCSAS